MTCQRLQIAPLQATVAPGGSLQLHANLRCSDGSSREVSSDSATRWALLDTGDPATGSVGPSGLVTAGNAAGTLSIQVTHASAGQAVLTADSSVAVRGEPITAFVLSPGQARIHVGGDVSFHATATFDGGGTSDATLVANWSASAPSVADVPCSSIPGRACGLAAGTTQVQASWRGASAQAQLEVLAASSVQSIAVTPASTQLPQGTGACVALSATATHADGVSDPVRVTWSADGGAGDGGVLFTPRQNASSTQACVLPATGPGIQQIGASDSTVSGAATLEVCATTTRLLTVAPLRPTVECSTDGGARCIGLLATAQLRYCGINDSANVNAVADWRVTAADAGFTVVGGLGCWVPQSCPTLPTVFTVEASFGGRTATSVVTVR